MGVSVEVFVIVGEGVGLLEDVIVTEGVTVDV